METARACFVFLLLSLPALPGRTEPSDEAPAGAIRGKFLRHAPTRPVKVNLHRGDGGFLRHLSPSPDGGFAAEGLHLGEYFLVTAPDRRLPVQWITPDLKLTEAKPVAELPPLDYLASVPVSPKRGQSYRRAVLTKDRPIIFRWSPYPGRVGYEVKLHALQGENAWESGRVRGTNWRFHGGRSFRRARLQKVYAWTLHIYPEHGLWQGHSRQQMLYKGGAGRLWRSDGEHVYLQVPRWYREHAKEFQALKALELAYQFHEDLTGRRPFGGRPAGVLFDSAIEFSHSGNPAHIGASYWRYDRPPWFTIFHEMGHDFETGCSPSLSEAICHQRSGVPFYNTFVEAFATLAAFHAAERMEEMALRGLDPSTVESVRRNVGERAAQCRLAWESHLAAGLDFDQLNPDSADGMLLELCDEFGWEAFRRFFRLFGPSDEVLEMCCQADTHPKRMSLVLSALSVAASQDLLDRFLKWGFPVDSSEYEIFREKWQEITKTHPSVPLSR